MPLQVYGKDQETHSFLPIFGSIRIFITEAVAIQLMSTIYFHTLLAELGPSDRRPKLLFLHIWTVNHGSSWSFSWTSFLFLRIVGNRTHRKGTKVVISCLRHDSRTDIDLSPIRSFEEHSTSSYLLHATFTPWLSFRRFMCLRWRWVLKPLVIDQCCRRDRGNSSANNVSVTSLCNHGGTKTLATFRPIT